MATDFTLDSEMLDVLTLDGESEAVSTPTDEIWYNYFGLQNANILTEFVKVSAPNLDLASRAFPRADGMYAETYNYRQNRIKLQGTLQSTSRTALEALMDSMRKALGATGGKILRISFAGQARYFDNCWPTNIEGIFDGRDHYHIDWCPFSIEFTSLHPYGRDLDRTILDAPYAITSSPTNFILANAGTAPTEPVITLSVVTAGTLSAVNLENQENGDSITVTRAFSDGDTLEIDSENKTVKVNGVAVEYSGVIPKVVAGDNILVVTLTGSGYSVSFSEQHYSRYL